MAHGGIAASEGQNLPEDRPLIVAVSARALFDLEDADRVYREQGEAAFLVHHREREDVPLAPGCALPLVRALDHLNRFAPPTPPDGKKRRLVEVIVVSSCHPEVGLRILRSVEALGLDIERAAFTNGGDCAGYLTAFGVDLLLSRSAEDAQRAVDAGIAAAQVADLPDGQRGEPADGPIRLALDGDAVVFSSEAEIVNRTLGLDAFHEHERGRAHEPLPEGPFARVLRAVARIQAATGGRAFRVALVTARGAQAHERALRTLRAWGLAVDEALFLGGLPKGAVLHAFAPAMFFDDSPANVAGAACLVPSALVPWPSQEAAAVSPALPAPAA